VFNVFVSLIHCFLYVWSNSATFGEMVFQNGLACETFLHTIQGGGDVAEQY